MGKRADLSREVQDSKILYDQVVVRLFPFPGGPNNKDDSMLGSILGSP